MTTHGDKQIQELGQRMLVRAAHKLGGVAALAKHLGLAEATVGDFIEGTLAPPVEVILKAMEPLLDEPEAIWRDSPVIHKPASKADK